MVGLHPSPLKPCRAVHATFGIILRCHEHKHSIANTTYWIHSQRKYQWTCGGYSQIIGSWCCCLLLSPCTTFQTNKGYDHWCLYTQLVFSHTFELSFLPVSGWTSLRGAALRDGASLTPKYILNLVKSEGVRITRDFSSKENVYLVASAFPTISLWSYPGISSLRWS